MKKKKIFFWFVVLVTIGLFAFNRSFTAGGSITGSVVPLTAVSRIYAVTGKDSFPATIVGNRFTISSLRTASYSLMIEVLSPYHPYYKDNIPITEGVTTEVGEIRLTE